MLPQHYPTNLIALRSNPSTCPPKPWRRRKLRPSEARFGAKKGHLHTLQTIPPLPFSGFLNRTSAIHSGGNPTNPILSSSASGPVPSTTPSAGLPYLPHPTLSNEPIATACVLPPAVSSPTLNVGSTTFATAPTTGHLFSPSLLQFSTPSPPSAPPPGLRLVLPER